MGNQNYSNQFKQSAVSKLMNRGSRSVEDVLLEVGVSSPTLYKWKAKFANISEMDKSETPPHKRSALDKIRAVSTYEDLPEDKRGDFLRKEGLQTGHIEKWRDQFVKSLEGESMTKQERKEKQDDKRKIKELEKELRRKEKALAETSALLVLKKKQT